MREMLIKLWILKEVGSFNLTALEEMILTILKGPSCHSASFHAMLRFLVLNQTLLPTLYSGVIPLLKSVYRCMSSHALDNAAWASS